ncbi:MAG: DNA repair and recombination protein RadB [Methanomassiliicoccales archaeon]|nr:DNA repair and recombination protein RadB [Methanomassiliicoccales archaeon]
MTVESPSVIPFNCEPLDEMLDGGVEGGCLTMIYGEAGTGKTNLCLTLARNVALQGKKTIYVDSEGMSMQRLKQVAGSDEEKVLKEVLVSEVHSLDDQDRMIGKAIKLVEGNSDLGLIVIDSMTMFYRLASRDEERNERRVLAAQSAKLLTLARRTGLPVVATSQVYTDVETGTFEALGGNVLHHNAKTIIRVERLGPGKRRAVLMKHRHLAEGRTAVFYLTENGVEAEPQRSLPTA